MGLAGGALSNAPAQSKPKPSAEIEAKLTEVVKAACPEVVIAGANIEKQMGMDIYLISLRRERKWTRTCCLKHCSDISTFNANKNLILRFNSHLC